MTDETKRIVKELQQYAKRYRDGSTLGRAIVNTEDVMDDAADTIERLSAELEAAKRDIQKALVDCGDAACKLCAHYVKCDGDKCPEYTKGVGVRGVDGREYPNFEWSCEDWEFGTCARMVNTPCNCCDYENHWEWRGLPKEE